MQITEYAIVGIAPLIVDNLGGRQLVALFNKYGSRDVYDENGLPDIGKGNGQRPSKTEYVKKRLSGINGKQELRDLLNEIVNGNKEVIQKINELLNGEGYGVADVGGSYFIQGGIVVREEPVVNEAHFQDIQNRILKALDDAQVSIKVVMAWFTNEVLLNKLVDKHKQGVEVIIAIYDDGINKKHGVDITLVPHLRIKKGQRGGLMHDKFCVIDNQVVITGSYNWSENAEFKNDENIVVEHDNKQASKFSVEFRRLTT